MDKAWFISDAAETPEELPADGWREVSLPHQWSLEGVEAQAGWYRLEVGASSASRRWLRLQSDYFAELWTGDGRLARHEGYFEPWTVELPAEVHTLLMRVAAPYEPLGSVWPSLKRQIKGVFGQHDCRPGGGSTQGQERGSGGLWAAPQVWESGAVALMALRAQAVPVASGWKLSIELEIDSLEAGPARASLRLGPEDFAGSTLAAERTLVLRPGRQTYELVWDLPEMERWEIWERGFPHLYRLEVELEGGQAQTLIGFRTIAQDGDWLLLNGRRVFLRGSNVIPTQWLASYDRAKAERDVGLIKEANLNAVRVHAHVAAPEFYEQCDRQGVLIWQDFPLQWGYAEDEGFAEEALRQARAMVSYLGNHPSIYLWNAHNEPSHNRHTLDPLLASALRSADPLRLVKEASDFREHPYPGWYVGNMRDFLALPGAPLPSEFGAQALPRADLLRRILGDAAWPPDWKTWSYYNFQPDQTFHVAGLGTGDSLEGFVEHSQDYQAKLLQFAIHAYRRAKGRITGYFQFMFMEPWEGITWAVVDVERNPKKGYEALKWASSPVLLSLVVDRDTVEVGPWTPIGEAWVVSDLERPLDLRVRVTVEGDRSVVFLEEEVHLEPQEVRCVFRQGDVWEMSAAGRQPFDESAERLAALGAGTYRVVGEVFEGDRLWSRQEEQVTLVDPTVRSLRMF